MASFPVPDDEVKRLEKLRGLGFERFDEADFVRRLVDIAAGRFETDLSYVGVMGETDQDILACAGDDTKEADRETSACAYTIMQDEVLVISDILDDERFDDNELLHEKGIDWYAGVPITIDGQNVGTFCLMDRSNQHLTDQDRAHLRAFAAEIEDQIVLRNKIYDKKADSLSERVNEKLDMS